MSRIGQYAVSVGLPAMIAALPGALLLDAFGADLWMAVRIWFGVSGLVTAFGLMFVLIDLAKD